MLWVLVVNCEYMVNVLISLLLKEQSVLDQHCVSAVGLFCLLSSDQNFKIFIYIKTCLKGPLKKKTKYWFARPIIA